MRAVECKCGEHFEAQTDAALPDLLRRHAEVEHPEWTEADIKAHLVRSAYDHVADGAEAQA